MARNFLEYDYKQNTVIDIFNDHVLKAGEKPFLKRREKEGWKDITWNQAASQVEALASYQSLPHRCEEVGVLDEVVYVNDSKSTNLDSLEKALISEHRPVVLIAGGKDKGFDFFIKWR